MPGPHPERHPYPSQQQTIPAAPYARGTRLLRFCSLLLGVAFVLVLGLTLVTILVKRPKQPPTAPVEQMAARNENESPRPRIDDTQVQKPTPIDPNPAANDQRGHADEVDRILGGSFHPHPREDVPSLADAPPPLPPPAPSSKQTPLTSESKQQIPSPRLSDKSSPTIADEAIEQRLQASEDDLRKQLLAVPEVLLFSDLVVEDFRQREKHDESKMKGVPVSQIEFAYNMQLNKYMRQAGLKEGLPLLSGPNCQLDPAAASIVQILSSNLRSMGFVSVPGTPARSIFRSKGRTTNVSGTNTPNEKIEAFQEWCDTNSVEKFRGAVATLLQVLQVEDAPMRLLLVRELSKAKGQGTTAALAKRAMVDLSPEVRQAAVDALRKRPAGQYVPVLLKGLRYPWPPVADHAALALRALKPENAVSKLVDLLDLPDPASPFLDKRTQKPVVGELVRLNHMRHCLLCHVPSANDKDGLVRGLVPTPGQPLPSLYYASRTGNFVRADITFLRQDFSGNLPVPAAAPWPKEQRFDFVTRIRPAKPEEIAESPTQTGKYPQREAVMYALRGITGKNGGDISDEWRKMLGFAVRATETKKEVSLDKSSTRPKDKDEVLRKSESATKVEPPKP